MQLRAIECFNEGEKNRGKDSFSKAELSNKIYLQSICLHHCKQEIDLKHNPLNILIIV